MYLWHKHPYRLPLGDYECESARRLVDKYVPHTHTDATTTPIKYAPILGSMINGGQRGGGETYVSSKTVIVGEKEWNG